MTALFGTEGLEIFSSPFLDVVQSGYLENDQRKK
jgi:hypothetical protein